MLWRTAEEAYALTSAHPMEPIARQLAMLAASAVVVAKVRRRIEWASRLLMPMLALLLLALAV